MLMFRNLCACCILTILMAGVTFGQSGTASCTQTITPGLISGTCTITLGSGKMTYSYSDQTNRHCVDRHGTVYTWEFDQLSGFSYTDPAGNTSQLPLGFTKIVSPGVSFSNCPKGTNFPNSAEVALTANIADFGQALTFMPNTNSANITALDVGSLDPKFQVLAVVYAPPGAASNVSYGASTMLGVTDSFSNSFTNAMTESDSVSLKDAGIPGILGASVSKTVTTGYTQTTGSLGSIAINKVSSITNQINGPVNSLAGINHDFDQIFISLNPVFEIERFGNHVILGQGGFDPRDPTGELDVIPLFVVDLKNLLNGTFTGDPDIPFRLSRAWAGSGQGLTTADLNTILARDPFANGATTIDSTRFDLTGQNFNYIPPPAGGQPNKTTFLLNYTNTTSQGQMASDSYSVGTTTDVSVSFLGFLTSEMKNSNTLTWTSSFTLQTTQASGQTATLVLTGPPAGYNGPTNLLVYKDNIYGTFMFNLIP
jgi:hypothetical protein